MKTAFGVSVTSIERPLTLETVELLGKSRIQTFEAAPGYEPDVRAAFCRMLGQTGKSAPTYHVPFGNDYDFSAPDDTVRARAIANLDALIPEVLELGSKTLVVHASFEPIPDGERAVRIAQTRRSLGELEPLLAANDLKLVVELLPRSCIGNTGAEILAILQGFPDRIGACLDVNHFMADIDGVSRAVDALGAKLYHLHISDYDAIDERHWLPGKGKIDWPGFIAALSRNNYRGVFNYELALRDIPTPAERIAVVEDNYFNFIRPLMQPE